MIVRAAEPTEPRATELLTASQTMMREMFDVDDCHFLSFEALSQADVQFYVSEIEGETVACGAVRIFPEYAEVKSMFTAPEARGKGAAQAILARLELVAKAHGLQWMRLETGDTLDAAHRLYEQAGYHRCPPFGDYVAAERSVFMEKQIG